MVKRKIMCSDLSLQAQGYSLIFITSMQPKDHSSKLYCWVSLGLTELLLACNGPYNGKRCRLGVRLTCGFLLTLSCLRSVAVPSVICPAAQSLLQLSLGSMMILTSSGSGQSLMHVEKASTSSANLISECSLPKKKKKIQKCFLLIVKEMHFPFIGFSSGNHQLPVGEREWAEAEFGLCCTVLVRRWMCCGCTAQAPYVVLCLGQDCSHRSALALPKRSLTDMNGLLLLSLKVDSTLNARQARVH